jgi:hypothetical protein
VPREGRLNGALIIESIGMLRLSLLDEVLAKGILYG